MSSKQAKGSKGRKIGNSVHKEMQRRIKSGKVKKGTVGSLFGHSR